MGVVEGVEQEGAADVGVRVPGASAQALGNRGEYRVWGVTEELAARRGGRRLEGDEGAEVGASGAPELPQVVFNAEVVLLKDRGVGDKGEGRRGNDGSGGERVEEGGGDGHG